MISDRFTGNVNQTMVLWALRGPVKPRQSMSSVSLAVTEMVVRMIVKAVNIIVMIIFSRSSCLLQNPTSLYLQSLKCDDNPPELPD